MQLLTNITALAAFAIHLNLLWTCWRLSPTLTGVWMVQRSWNCTVHTSYQNLTMGTLYMCQLEFHTCKGWIAFRIVHNAYALVSSEHSPATGGKRGPLNLRRGKLTVKYIMKLKSIPDNQAYNCILLPNYMLFFVRQDPLSWLIPPLGVRRKELMLSTDISFECFDKSSSFTCAYSAYQASWIHLCSTRYWIQIWNTFRSLQIKI